MVEEQPGNFEELYDTSWFQRSRGKRSYSPVIYVEIKIESLPYTFPNDEKKYLPIVNIFYVYVLSCGVVEPLAGPEEAVLV